MAVTRKAARPPARRPDGLELFVWEGTDKRGTRMKGEQQSKSAALLRAELRRQGIVPTVVKTKPKPKVKPKATGKPKPTAKAKPKGNPKAKKKP